MKLKTVCKRLTKNLTVCERHQEKERVLNSLQKTSLQEKSTQRSARVSKNETKMVCKKKAAKDLQI